MMLALARLPIARLTRTPRAWIPIAGWALLALVAALAAHRIGSPRGAGHVLAGPFGGFALPLLVYSVVSAALGGEGVLRSTRALTSFGAPPAGAAAAAIATAVIASAALAAVVAGGVAAVAHGASDPPILRDLLTSAWIAALGASAYAALFAFGSTFGARGGGRTAALVLDWVLGSGTGATALVTPRAHVRSLLGGDAPLELSQRASAGLLVALAVVFTLLAVFRARRLRD